MDSRRVKARRPRRCPECRVEIPAGAHYVRHAGIFDGDFFSAVQCAACEDLGVRLLESFRICVAIPWDEKVYSFGSLIETAMLHAEADWDGYAGLSFAQLRDLLPALLERADAAERERRRQIRVRRKAEAEERAARAATEADAA